MAYLYGHRTGHSRSAAPDQPQGESLAVDGDRLLVGSEGKSSAVYSVPMPGGDPSPEASASASGSASAPQRKPETAPAPTTVSRGRRWG